MGTSQGVIGLLESPQIVAAIIAAAVALLTTVLASPLRLWVEKSLLTRKLDLEYRFEEKKKFRSLIGKYHGRIIEAGETLNYRLWNLYQNYDKGWLRTDRHADRMGYYFSTTVFRFLNFVFFIRKFQNEAVYLDSRVAEKSDYLFRAFVKTFMWVLTDVRLFAGLSYDRSTASDHFFAYQLKEICEVDDAGGDFVSFDELPALLKGQKWQPVCEFFNNLRPEDERYRWDRLIVFHACLLTFLNQFGYPSDRSAPDQIASVLGQMRHRNVLENAIQFFPKLGLEKHSEGAQLFRLMYERLLSWV